MQIRGRKRGLGFMIRKIKKEVGCSFKENIQYMDQTLPVEKSFALSAGRWRSVEKNRYSTTLMDL